MPFAAEHTASTAATYSATFMRLLPLNFAASTLSLQGAYGCAVGERIWTAQLSLLGANTVPLLQLPPAVALFGARSAHESLASRLADCLFDISDTFEYVHVMWSGVMCLLLALSSTFSCHSRYVVEAVHPLPQLSAFVSLFVLLYIFFQFVFDWIHFLELHLFLFICCHSSTILQCFFFLITLSHFFRLLYLSGVQLHFAHLITANERATCQPAASFYFARAVILSLIEVLLRPSCWRIIF